MLPQLAEVVAAVLVGSKLLSRWWVGGSNGNKANLSPARAGTGLSLAKKLKNRPSLIVEKQFNTGN